MNTVSKVKLFDDEHWQKIMLRYANRPGAMFAVGDGQSCRWRIRQADASDLPALRSGLQIEAAKSVPRKRLLKAFRERIAELELEEATRSGRSLVPVGGGRSETHTVSAFVDCRPDLVYAFVSLPGNLPRWATSFCSGISECEGHFFIETLQGRREIRFAERNSVGVADHYVKLAQGGENCVPVRVLANGKGSEVFLTLFRPAGLPDSAFDDEVRMALRDLATLKMLIEAEQVSL